jgi:hypothetical protein
VAVDNTATPPFMYYHLDIFQQNWLAKIWVYLYIIFRVSF